MTVSIVTGDDVAIEVTLKSNGSKFTIPSGATVKAAIFDYRDYSVVLGPTASLEAALGADWPNGKAIVSFTAAETDGLDWKAGLGIEVEVDDGSSKKSWQGKGVEIVPGAIEN